ncbi:MAG: membrane protease YdiL (CAAX protease family) [Granulosicoccus sp.]|jgi:membrane protease YdiL (CAAX protease family)
MYLMDLPLRRSPPPATTILLLVIAYPILEEIVFRGAIQGALLKQAALRHSIAGISIACVIASSLFATAHLLQQTAGWAALILLPSMLFGWARERHKTLYSPILLHMTYNAGFIGIFQAGATS